MNTARIVLRHLIPALQAIQDEISEMESGEVALKESETKKHLQPEKQSFATRQDGLLNVSQAAAFLGLKKTTIYQLTCSRRIPYYKVGSRTMFKEQQLLAWLDGFAVSPINLVGRPRSRKGPLAS